MSPRRFAPAVFLMCLIAWPAMADSQSSNGSSNCSNGRCTRLDSYTEQRDGRLRGWTRWHEWSERHDGRARRGRPHHQRQDDDD